jgi:hypothetical protein
VLYAATWVLALSRQTNMEGNPVNWDHKLADLCRPRREALWPPRSWDVSCAA